MLIFILLAASSLQIIWSFSVLNPAPALDLITNSKVRFIWIFEQEFYIWVQLSAPLTPMSLSTPIVRERQTD